MEWTEREAKIKVIGGIRKYNETKKAMAGNNQERAELAVWKIDSLLYRMYLRASLRNQRKKNIAMRKNDSEDYGYGRWRLEYQQK